MSEEGSNVAKSLRLIVQNLDKFRETVKNRFVIINERLDGYEKEINDLKTRINKLATTSPQPTSTSNNVELKNILRRLDSLEQQIKTSKSTAMPLSPEIPAARKVTPTTKPRVIPSVPSAAKVPSPVSAKTSSGIPPTPASIPAPPSASTSDLPPTPPASIPQKKKVVVDDKKFADDNDGLLDALKKLDSI